MSWKNPSPACGGRRMMFRRVVFLLSIGFIVVASALAGQTVHNDQPPFTLVVPDGFEPAPQFVGQKEIIQAFFSSGGEANTGKILLFVERLGGVIGREHLK